MLDITNGANLETQRWTDVRVDTLKRMWAEGCSASEIAIELDCGITRNAVIGKVHRLGLLKRESRKLSRTRAKQNEDRGTTQRIRKMLVRSPSSGGVRMVESVKHEEPPVPQGFLGLTLMQLEAWRCHYPRGEGVNILFCGQPVIRDSYCTECWDITHKCVTEAQANKIFNAMARYK